MCLYYELESKGKAAQQYIKKVVESLEKTLISDVNNKLGGATLRQKS